MIGVQLVTASVDDLLLLLLLVGRSSSDGRTRSGFGVGAAGRLAPRRIAFHVVEFVVMIRLNRIAALEITGSGMDESK